MLRRAQSRIVHNPTVTTLRGWFDFISDPGEWNRLQKLSADFTKASEALKAWGLIEGDDIGGVLSASTLLLNHVSSALMQYASHGHSMRRQLKAIRTRIENLDDLKRQRRTTCQKVEEAETQLENMDPEHRNFSSRTEALNGFRQAVREMNSTIKLEEAALADFKRTSTKMWMGLKFGGLVECCEKGAIAGRFGKSVIAEISEEITQPGLPRNHNYRRDEVESCVANAHRGVNAVALSTVPFVGFRDRDQYIQRSSDTAPQVTEAPLSDTNRGVNAVTLSTVPFQVVGFHDRDQVQRSSDIPQATEAPLSDIPPAAFYISSQMGYVEPSNNGPPSLLSGEPQLPPSFPQPQCSCGEPMASSLVDQPPPGSMSSFPYAQETAEYSLPPSFSYQQPEFNNGTVIDNGVNVPSIDMGPVASLNIARGLTPTPSVSMSVPATVTGPVASLNIARGLTPAPSVSMSVPATVTGPVAYLDTASMNNEAAGGQFAEPQVHVRSPGTFGGATRDPFSMRARYGMDIVEEPVAEAPPEPPKRGVWSRILRVFKK